jgi:AraC-like DNA-binding protein
MCAVAAMHVLSSTKIRRRRVRYEYPANLRQIVLSSLHTSSARNVAKTYGIPLSTLYRWRKYLDQSNCERRGKQSCTEVVGRTAESKMRTSFPQGELADSTSARELPNSRRYRFTRARMRKSRQVLERLARAHSFIECKYFENINCARLAAIARMSRCHFVRVYTQAFGESPHQHLLRKRADAALSLLNMTLQPTLSIASAVGFESTSSLTKAIKKFSKTGIPHNVHR